LFCGVVRGPGKYLACIRVSAGSLSWPIIVQSRLLGHRVQVLVLGVMLGFVRGCEAPVPSAARRGSRPRGRVLADGRSGLVREDFLDTEDRARFWPMRARCCSRPARNLAFWALEFRATPFHNDSGSFRELNHPLWTPGKLCSDHRSGQSQIHYPIIVGFCSMVRHISRANFCPPEPHSTGFVVGRTLCMIVKRSR